MRAICATVAAWAGGAALMLSVGTAPAEALREVRVAPAQRLQRVIDDAQAGAVLVLADGTYYGCIRIDKPLTLRAENPGRAMLSNALPQMPVFRAEEAMAGLYVAEVAHPVRWVMVDERNLYDYVTPEDLKSFTARARHTRLKEDHAGPFEEGFAWADGRLYLRLKDQADPAGAKIEVNGPDLDGRAEFLKDNGLSATDSFVRPTTQPVILHYPGQPDRELLFPRDLGVLVSVEADGVTLEGLRLHLAPDVLVDIKSAADTTIRDCYFDGFQYAINTSEGASRLTVEHCEFSGGKLYERYRALQTAGSGKRWEAIYFSNLEINVVAQKGPGFIFRHNFVYEAFDGVQPRGIAVERIGHVPDIPSEIHHNVVMNCVDNNLELDGWDRLLNLRAHHNLVVNGASLLSTAPIQRGPLMVDHNIFYNAIENGLHGGYLLKHNQQRAPLAVNTGLTVVHNTFVVPYKLLWTDAWFPPQYGSNTIENNVMVVDTSAPWQRDGFTPTRHNLLWGVKTSADHIVGAVHAPPGLAGEAPYDFHLSAESPAVGAGAQRDAAYHHRSIGPTDLGAIEHGHQWEMPRPGPRWGTWENLPARPAFPASLDRAWAGFDHDSR